MPRFALHVFQTAGAAEEGGSAVFASVQELAGTGGLETHAAEKSLWAAAAQAGIVDVDRWVVAAVLWQATDAVVAANIGSEGSPRVSRQGSQRAAAPAAERLEGGSSDKNAVLLTEATSLWEELREEAFSAVLGGHSSRSCDQEMVPTAELGPPSMSLGTPTPAPAGGHEQRKELLALAGETRGDENDTGRNPRQRYRALQSDFRSFDLALMRTLALAGKGHAELGFAGSIQAGAKTGSESSGNGSLECIENTLMHNFVVAGFAGGSRLNVPDIVDAVSLRRQRIISATAAAAVAAAGAADDRCPSRGTADKDDGNLDHPAGPVHLNGLSQNNRKSPVPNTELSAGETGAAWHTVRREVHLSEGDGYPVSADDAAADVLMEPDVEARTLAGIPVELRELFRAAALAKMARKKQQQQPHQRQQKEQQQARKRQMSVTVYVHRSAS